MWRLGQPRWYVLEGLRSLGFNFNVSVRGQRLAQLVSRAERGLTSYEKCRLEDLKAFCASRSIEGIDLRSRKRADFVAALEYADDDDASFTRLMDLPPELRVPIYSYYMDSFDAFDDWDIRQYRSDVEITSSRYAAPPPITQVCATIRQEAMPMFYGIFRLQLHPQLRKNGEWDLSTCKTSTKDFGLKVVPPHLIRYIKKIELHWYIPERADDFVEEEEEIQLSTTIDLPTSHKPLRIGDITIENIRSRYPGRDGWGEEILQVSKK